MTMTEFIKVAVCQCATAEELLLKVITECEIRGYSTKQMCAAANEAKAYYKHIAAYRERVKKGEKLRFVDTAKGGGVLRYIDGYECVLGMRELSDCISSGQRFEVYKCTNEVAFKFEDDDEFFAIYVK